MRPGNVQTGMVALADTIDPSIYTINQAERSFSIYSKVDTNIEVGSKSGPSYCQLWLTDTPMCSFIFVFQDLGLDGYYQEMFYANVNIASECYHLLAEINDPAL